MKEDVFVFPARRRRPAAPKKPRPLSYIEWAISSSNARSNPCLRFAPNRILHLAVVLPSLQTRHRHTECPASTRLRLSPVSTGPVHHPERRRTGEHVPRPDPRRVDSPGCHGANWRNPRRGRAKWYAGSPVKHFGQRHALPVPRALDPDPRQADPQRPLQGILEERLRPLLDSFRTLLDGTTNWPAVMDALAPTGYSGHVTFEYFHPFALPRSADLPDLRPLDRILGRKAYALLQSNQLSTRSSSSFMIALLP